MTRRAVQDVGLAIKRIQARHHRALDARLGELGLSLVQWDALRHLNRNPDASLRELAQLTFQSDQAFGTLAGRMVKRGLIERVDGPGRAIRHRITDKGERLLAEGSAVATEVLTASFAPLDDEEFATLAGLLARLT
ncbi:MarR family transcriptional regulator [Diaminobutyricibacter tongyongensis]|uniref:MarR family transcriptional regulator n=1 Tax=Leifsonia tongyongensis TaxID=1268043 RepID=A0A6L9XX25_9MICO|nr:MarR family transcriptional regulator [Diaminobutyricibacter tongyongensis]NEN05747.1 MarR family transcriptional regulator [Diaminobutyricibacter tongyongensis]